MESEIEGGMKNLKNSTARQIKYLDVNPQKWFENGHNDTKQYLPHFGDLQQIFCIFDADDSGSAISVTGHARHDPTTARSDVFSFVRGLGFHINS